MKNKFINSHNEGAYKTPSLYIYTICAEQGFGTSLPGITIKPWEDDDDTLER